jgi:hypothetical protein
MLPWPSRAKHNPFAGFDRHLRVVSPRVDPKNQYYSINSTIKWIRQETLERETS